MADEWIFIIFVIAVLILILLALWLAPVDESPVNQTLTITYSPTTPSVFSIDGVPQNPLRLMRNKQYTFNYASPPGQHPFYFTTDPVGGPGAPGMIAGSPAPFDTSTTVVFGPEYPNDFFYQCSLHRNMGSSITLT
ncbi:Hypothetical protein POVN_LOCUS336 [uncultured virus]|nr:Hypothetical protein POVN_LOCUS336 [uncultured virus]